MTRTNNFIAPIYLLAGISGVLLNLTCASFAPNDFVLTALIFVSIGLIAIGVVPEFWKSAPRPIYRWPMAYVILCYATYVFVSIGSE